MTLSVIHHKRAPPPTREHAAGEREVDLADRFDERR